MTKLSVIVITKNEAHNIENCLKSVFFADEIVIFDSGSTDDTVAIAKHYTPHVTVTPDWPGDGPQKNRALSKTTSDWVLCLDADERVSPELALEIQALLSEKARYAAYDIPYQSTYCGKPIHFGDWRGESHIRLFQRHLARFTENVVHCHLAVDGKIGKLKHKIIHHPFHHLGAMLHKLNDYSTQSAKALFDTGKTASLWTALSHASWSFLKGYILRLGFLDGPTGFILAMSNAQGTYYRYLKLRDLSKNAVSGSS